MQLRFHTQYRCWRDRERALLTVAYDTMARRAELVALDVDDFTFLPDGTGRALIRRSTTEASKRSTYYLFAAIQNLCRNVLWGKR
jgi:integrase